MCQLVKDGSSLKTRLGKLSKKLFGFKEGLWIWYEVIGANGETIISVEDEFDTMRRLAILSWADSREYVRIQLGDPKDLEEELGY